MAPGTPVSPASALALPPPVYGDLAEAQGLDRRGEARDPASWNPLGLAGGQGRGSRRPHVLESLRPGWVASRTWVEQQSCVRGWPELPV